MVEPLDTLPDRPLTVEEVRVLNDAGSMGALPYGWYRDEAVLSFLLVYADRSSSDDTGTAESGDTGAVDQSDNDPIGEVEVLNPASSDSGDDEFSVYAVGFDTDAGSWTVIAEIEPDAAFETVALTFREWTRETYDEAVQNAITVEPAEFEDLDSNGGDEESRSESG